MSKTYDSIIMNN